MLNQIEFYTCPDGSICIKPFEKPMFLFDQSCREIIGELIILIRDLYPQAFKALSEMYSKSEKNRDYYEYQIVHRFIRCNFGAYDALSYDIDRTGQLRIEEVQCPLRGECKYEGIICKPQLKTALSEREQEVATLLAQGLSRQEIADELNISLYTVIRHITNIKARLHFTKTSQIISHFHR